MKNSHFITIPICIITFVIVGLIYFNSDDDVTSSGDKELSDLGAQTHSKRSDGRRELQVKDSKERRADHLSKKEDTTPHSGRKEVELANGMVFEDFELNPFPITKSTKLHGWTGIDGMTLENIEKLAHNDLEKERLINENAWLDSRELVYRNETVQDILEKNLADGTVPEEFTLPGLDGKEYKVIIDSIQIDNSRLGDAATNTSAASGAISGHLVSDTESQVVIGFVNGFESGSLVTGDISLSFDSREEGQIMVTQTNPEKAQQFFEDTYPNGGAPSTSNSEGIVGEAPLTE